MSRVARPYQAQCIENVEKAFELHCAVMAVLPTGTGKSFTLREVVNGLRAAGRPVIAVAPQRQQATDLAENGIEATTLAHCLETKGVPSRAIVLVDEAGQVLGVISEKDFLSHLGVAESQNFLTLVASCLQGGGCVTMPIEQRQAADLMTSPAVTVGPEASVRDIAALFTGRGLNRVPVTDPSGRLLGLVSRGDLVRAAMGGGAP